MVIKILEEGKEKIVGMKELIRQPQSELQVVREYLRRQGYLITDENMILEEGKYYPMMKVCPQKNKGNDCARKEIEQQRLEDKFGPVLLRKRHPVLKEFLHREYTICEQILDNLRNNGRDGSNRQQEILDKKKDIEAALSCF